MSKLLVIMSLIFGVLLSSPSFAQSHIQNDYFVNLNTIKLIKCTQDGDNFSGTAFIIGKNRVVTANHVIYGATECTIDGKPTTFVSNQPEEDIAVLSVDLGSNPPKLEISCDGYVYSNIYLSIGYSRGSDFAIEKLYAAGGHVNHRKTSDYPNVIKHLYTLDGYIYQGMSGGPIIDMSGRVVGINNTSDEDGLVGSKSLSDTSLCAALVIPKKPLYPPKKENDGDDDSTENPLILQLPIVPAPVPAPAPAEPASPVAPIIPPITIIPPKS